MYQKEGLGGGRLGSHKKEKPPGKELGGLLPTPAIIQLTRRGNIGEAEHPRFAKTEVREETIGETQGLASRPKRKKCVNPVKRGGGRAKREEHRNEETLKPRVL